MLFPHCNDILVKDKLSRYMRLTTEEQQRILQGTTGQQRAQLEEAMRSGFEITAGKDVYDRIRLRKNSSCGIDEIKEISPDDERSIYY